MYIYILILTLSLIASIINPRKFTFLDSFVFIVLGLISGFRYNVGTDFSSYQMLIYQVSQGRDSHAEVGFEIITRLLLFFGFSDQGVFLFFSILTILFFYLGIRYYYSKTSFFKPVFYIMFIIFIYFSSFNVIRQILAASILFYATKYIFNKSFFKYSIFVLLAMSFHFSSFIFFILYFVVKKEYSKLSFSIVLIFSTILSTTNSISKILETIVYRFPIIDLGGYLSKYIVSDYNPNLADYGIVFFMNVFILIFIITFKENFIKNQFQIVFLNFYFIYIVSMVLALDFFAVSRFQYFFSIYMVLCISSVDKTFNFDSRRIVKSIMVLLYIFLYVYIISRGYMNPDNTDIIPYNYNFDIF